MPIGLGAGKDRGMADNDLSTALRKFLLAYERLDAMWRVTFAMDADEKLVVMFLRDEAIATADVTGSIGIPVADMPRVLERLERDGFIRRLEEQGAIAITKKGLRARLEFDAAMEDMCHVAADADSRRFLEKATEVTNRRVGALGAGVPH